jgi:uncharacterized protein YjbJ (UPF0337 family)
MSWDRIAGNWDQWKGRIRERWGRLSEDQLDVIGGRRDQLTGRIEEIYGLSHEEAERQLRNWERNLAIDGFDFDEEDLVFDDETDPGINGRES